MAEGGSGIWTPGGEHRIGEHEARPEERALSPEELTELMRQLKIGDVLLSNMSTLAQLAYAKLDPEARDLAQAQLAIEALRALLPVLEPSIPREVTRDFTQVLSNLQLAYARAAEEGKGQPQEAPAEGTAGASPSGSSEPPEQPRPAEAATADRPSQEPPQAEGEAGSAGA